MIQIEELLISTRVIDKLWGKHRVLSSECVQAFADDPDRVAGWATEKTGKYGKRLKVIGETWSGRELTGFLYPTDDPTVWRLSTAFEEE